MFEFERDFAEGMTCIPMAVRFKLDACGIKLSLKEWAKLTPQQRMELFGAPPPVFNDRMRALAPEAKSLEVDARPPWDDAGVVPVTVADKAREKGIALDVARWAALTPLQRFALCKLCRPKHDNENFVPACREFGL